MRALILLLALVCELSFAIGPAHQLGKHHGRGTSQPAPTTEEITITGSDIQIAQMRAAEPTTVLNSQVRFRVTRWSSSAYDEVALIRPCAAPCSGGNLLPASLQGATITAVRFEPTRSNGCNTCDPGTSTFHLKQVLRTDLDPATLTWNLRATGSSWETAGAQGALDAGASLTSLAQTTYAFETYSFDTSSTLVTYFQALANGAQTQPWLLMYLAASKGSYNTFDGPTGTNPPRFVVTKQVN